MPETTVIPAQPGFFVISWTADDDGDLWSDTPVIAWKIQDLDIGGFVLPLTLDPEVNGWVDTPDFNWAIRTPHNLYIVETETIDNLDSLKWVFQRNAEIREKRRGG